MGYCNLIKKEKDYSLVTLYDIKNHLNVDFDFTDDDVLISGYIESAVSLAEDYTGIDIAITDNELTYVEFDGDSLKIEECPFVEIESISYIDSNNNVVTLTTDDYKIKIQRISFMVLFESNIKTDELIVKFRTGYNCDTVPRSIKAAILIKTNDLYDMERTSHTVGVNFRSTEAFERSLNGHVINRW